MASWLKAAEDLFEVVDRKAKLVVNEISDEQSELQQSASRVQEIQATISKSKDKSQTRRTSTDFSKITTTDQDQDSTETSLVNATGNKNKGVSGEISANKSIPPKDLNSESVSDIDKDSIKSSQKNKDPVNIQTDQSDSSLAVEGNNMEIVASVNNDVRYEVSKGDDEKTSTLAVAGDQAINGGHSAIANAEANQATSDPYIKVEEITGSQRVDETKSINSAKANDTGSAAEPSSSLDQNNEREHNGSPVRVQEQLDEAQGLLKVAISTGQSKEARLARVCAGLSSRLQEYKTENAQLEELLGAERELSTSYQAHIKQLEKELSTRKTEVTRVESSFADALAAKNSEIESLMNALDNLKKQAAASEGSLSSLQENMDTILRSRELTETRMMQALREELAAAERRAEEERAAHSATKMAAVEREVELEHRAVEASNALARIQRSADESTSRAIELEHKIALLEVECASLNQELQEMEACARRGQKKSSEEANQFLQIQAWQEEVERARQSQRDAEGKLSSLEADMQKLRVEMAAMKRDAEHYSRHEHMELEKRYRELTDLLYHKQTQLETMASEKAAAEFQLEKEVRHLQEAQMEAERSRSSRRALTSWEEDSDFKVLESLPLHHRHMAAASKQLEKAAMLLDSGAVRATRFLWRYPYARVVFLFYLVFVHLFLMYLLHRLQEQADTISSKEVASSMGFDNSNLP